MSHTAPPVRIRKALVPHASLRWQGSPGWMSMALAAALCIDARLEAQVSPIPFGVAEGTLSSGSPLAITAPGASRTMQIHDDVARSIRPIRSIQFRRDGLLRDTMGPLSVELSLVMSIGATSAAAPDATYANNHGPNPVTVVAMRVVNFPSTQPGTRLPAPFEYILPLDVPFTHSTLSPAGPLVWDMVTRNVTFTGERPTFDAVSLVRSTNPLTAGFGYGDGCVASGRTQPMSVLLGSSPNWPNGSVTVTVGANGAPASAPAVALIGFTNLAQFVVPGTTVGTSGPCSLLLDPAASLPLATTPQGLAISPLVVPVDPSFHGEQFFHQTVAIDPAANSLGVVTSNAAVQQFIAPYSGIAVGRVQSLGTSGPTGIVTSGTATMTRFAR